MPSAEYELTYLRAAADTLEDYLLSNELYWQLGIRPPSGETPYPPLTLGEMSLTQARLSARNLMGAQREEMERLNEKIDTVHSRWQVAWERKAARGFQARLMLWRDFLEEYRENPGANADRYAYEVRRRVMLFFLSQAAGEIPQQEIDLLGALDRVLQGALIPAGFVWEDELASGFPPTTFWYLYGRLKGD
jgi:hypothetical protein